MGDCPASICYETRYRPSVAPDECAECRRTRLTPPGSDGPILYKEEVRGHVNLCRLKVQRPKSLVQVPTLKPKT